MVVRGEGLSNKDYWALRNQELNHIQDSMRSDSGYKGALTKLYGQVQEDIEKDILRDIERFAHREGVSMTEARKLINRTDVEGFSDRAAQYVRTRDFSDTANRELRAYNVTMRTNRLELLNAKINLNTVALANEEEYLLQRHLSKGFIEEYKRQAGILEMTVPSGEQLERMATSFVEAEFRNTVFSERIWQNQKELQNGLENGLRRSIMQGQNPRATARDLRELVSDEFKNKKYAADRIAITETGRIQTEAQKKSFEDGGFERYVFIAEPDACDDCGGLDGQDFKVKDMQPGENANPIHPFVNARQLRMYQEISCRA